MPYKQKNESGKKMRGRIMAKLRKAVDEIVSELGSEKGSLLAILLAVQDEIP